MGPAYVVMRDAQLQLRSAQVALEKASKSRGLPFISRLELMVKKREQALAKAEKQLEETVVHLHNVTLSSSRSISKDVVGARQGYRDAVVAMLPHDLRNAQIGPQER